MSPLAPGDLVLVATGSRSLEGIVFEVPSSAKVIVAVVDRSRGPVLRTVDASAVTERDAAGSADAQLRALIKRSMSTARSSAGRGPVSGGSDRAGFKRGAAHRSTGR